MSALLPSFRKSLSSDPGGRGSVCQRCCLFSASPSSLTSPFTVVGQEPQVIRTLPWLHTTPCPNNVFKFKSYKAFLIKQFSLSRSSVWPTGLQCLSHYFCRELGAWRLGSVCQRCCLLSVSFSPLILAVGQRLSALLPYFRQSLSCKPSYHNGWTGVTDI